MQTLYARRRNIRHKIGNDIISWLRQSIRVGVKPHYASYLADKVNTFIHSLLYSDKSKIYDLNLSLHFIPPFFLFERKMLYQFAIACRVSFNSRNDRYYDHVLSNPMISWSRINLYTPRLGTAALRQECESTVRSRYILCCVNRANSHGMWFFVMQDDF